MKFIRCYIENFGKLHQFKLQFSEGITIINQPNGFGKTTLTAFIKAILYGFPKNNPSTEKNDRKRYMPWQGGIYGGYLEFEYNQIIYRIERTFGATPKEDRYKLFQLSPFGISSDFSENIGFEIYGVSSDQFDQTIYFPQIRWSVITSSKDLKDRLTNIVEITLDIGAYEKAMKSLKSQRSALLPYRGKGGLLYKLSSEISENEKTLSLAAHAKRQLIEVNDRLRECEHELSKKKTALESLNNRVQIDLPPSSQNKISEQYHRLNSKMQQVQKELEFYDSQYPYGFPTDEELEACRLYLSRFDEVDERTDSSQSENIPDPETMEDYEDAMAEINDMKHHLNLIADNLEHEKPPILFLSLFSLLSFVFAGISYALIRYSFYTYLQIPMLIATVFSLIAVVVSVRRTILKHKRCQILQNQFERYNGQIQSLEKYLNSEMRIYGLCENNPIQSLEILQQRIEHREEIEHFKKSILLEVQKRLNKYCFVDFPESAASIDEIALAKNRHDLLLIHEQKLQDQLDALNQYYFESNHQNNHRNPSKQSSILVEQIECLQADIISLHKEIALLQQKSDTILELEYTLDARREQLKTAEKQVEYIDKAIEHLRNAFDSLSDSLLSPIKLKFRDYISSLLDIPSEKIFISEEISVSMELHGVQREQFHLSIGELDIIALCLRLAILDVLYPEHRPPLILDDPFVNLDSENLNNVLNTLKIIGKTHQIIYLTCHESRI